MKKFVQSILLSCLIAVGSFPFSFEYDAYMSRTAPVSTSTAYDDVTGVWKVDLRPTPDAAPYFEYLKITKVEGNRVFGTFYNSPIQYGNINDDWGTVVVAFITQDAGGNTYNTAFELDGNTLKGTTHSLGRDFLAVWTATKEMEE